MHGCHLAQSYGDRMAQELVRIILITRGKDWATFIARQRQKETRSPEDALLP